MGWHGRYLNAKQPGDRLVNRKLLERKCAACGERFLVAPNRPDATYCPTTRCSSKRARERAKR